jgi:hypothetical protein
MSTSGKAPMIEVLLDGRWQPLLHADMVPVGDCRIGQDSPQDLVASAWLNLHIDDNADYDEATRVQVITPYYINQEEDPVLLITRDGVLVEQPMEVGKPIVVDLFLPHALLPRKWAERVLALGHDAFPEFIEWWEPLYDDDDVAPVMVWSTKAA